MSRDPHPNAEPLAWSLPGGYGSEAFEWRVEDLAGPEKRRLDAEVQDAQEALFIALGSKGYPYLERYADACNAVAVLREAAVATVAYGQGLGAAAARLASADPADQDAMAEVGEAVAGLVLGAALDPNASLRAALAALGALATTVAVAEQTGATCPGRAIESAHGAPDRPRRSGRRARRRRPARGRA